MNCKVVQRSLSAYIDQELTGAEMLRLRAHVADCDRCAREEGELRVLKGLLCAMPAIEAPVGLEDRLLACIGAEKKAQSHLSAYVVAGLSVAAAIGAFILLPSSAPQSAARTVTPMKRDIAFEIGRDQVFAAGNDPLEGGHVILVGEPYGRK